MYKNKNFEHMRTLDEEMISFGVTENATLTKFDEVKNYKPRTIIDETLELIDPTPNIHTLFVQFDERFFGKALAPVIVKWSNRMTSSAGICSYNPRNKQCIITISAPLLKLRPRKDLVETLLHEMIHGFLFLTNTKKTVDRDGHGPDFCKHMHRINNEAGTNITIYHNFHDEVDLYKQHWWRCDGSCQTKAPYFGTVRRAMNRAPGPSDYWWNDHKQTCGGHFVKIKEPKKDNTKNTKINYETKLPTENAKHNGNILGWLIQKNNTSTDSTCENISTLQTNITSKGVIKKRGSTLKGHSSYNNENVKENNPSKALSQLNKSTLYKTIRSTEIRKLGSTTSNIHGWAPIFPPDNATSSKQYLNKAENLPKFSYCGMLGGTSNKSNLVEKFSSYNENIDDSINTVPVNAEKASNVENKRPDLNVNNENNLKLSSEHNFDLIDCPICNIITHKENINEHMDLCLQNDRKVDVTHIESNKLIVELSSSQKLPKSQIVQKRKSLLDMLPAKRTKIDKLTGLKLACCPICNKEIEEVKINAHLDDCLSQSNSKSDRSQVFNTKCNEKDECAIQKCLVCNTNITAEVSLNDHLEECIGSIFNDNSDIFGQSRGEDMKTIKYPCPVCMELHSHEYMNEHLDNCLIAQ